MCLCNVCASVKRSRSVPRIGKQDASFALEVCVCAFQFVCVLQRKQGGGGLTVCVCVCVLVCVRPQCPQEIGSAAAVKTAQGAPTHTDTKTHTHSTCGEYYSSSITPNHSIPSSFTRALLHFNLQWIQLHTHTRIFNTQAHTSTHTSLLSFPSELQSGR